MDDLAVQHALPDGTAPLLSAEEVATLSRKVPEWSIQNGRLTWETALDNFAAALSLVNQIGELAEAENHHPDMTIYRWNRVRVEFYTHTVSGLSLNDFVLAAKITALHARLAPHDR